jgi:hypothetical protein
MCKQTGTKGDTICDIELGNNPAIVFTWSQIGLDNLLVVCSANDI